jgi:hypothetical protein
MRDIELNSELDNCSLRAVDRILSPVCRLARIGRVVSMEFLFFLDGEQQDYEDSIKKLLHGELS